MVARMFDDLDVDNDGKLVRMVWVCSARDGGGVNMSAFCFTAVVIRRI